VIKLDENGNIVQWSDEKKAWIPYKTFSNVYAQSSDRYPGMEVGSPEQTTEEGPRYAGLTMPSLKPITIAPTTQQPVMASLLENITCVNLEVTGDAVFTGKTSFKTAIHAPWYDVTAATGEDVYIDLANGPHQYMVLREDKAIWLPSKPDEELMFSVVIMQDATGGWDCGFLVNGLDKETDGYPYVYWSELLYFAEATPEKPWGGQMHPAVVQTPYAIDMYSFTWMQFLDAGRGGYIAMATQNITHQGSIAL
jgi:hypothetical protein